MSLPIASLATSREDAASATSKPSLARFLGAEDLRRAEAALATALDPQGEGSLVGWENPESGVKGSFTPIGHAYPQDERICRVFVSKIDRKGDELAMRGTACAEKPGDWTIAEVSPMKKT